jgi:hypothetical protein
MLFRGYLPIMSGRSMAQLLQAHEIDCASVKPFLLSNAERVKAHALAMAREHGRPFEYLSAKMRKEDAARKIAERDGIEEGLVCVFSALEPCRTFSLRFTTGQPYVQTAKRKCSASVLLLHGPRSGPAARARADLVPAAGADLPQWPRVAGPQADGARHRAREDRLASSSVSPSCRVRSAWPIASPT